MKPRQKILHDSIINHPKPNCTYLLESGDGAGTTITLTFEGSKVTMLRFIDVAVCVYQLKKEASSRQIHSTTVTFLSNESIFATPARLPLYFLDSEGELGLISSIKVTLDTLQDISTDLEITPMDNPIKPDNINLRNECQKLVGNMHVVVGNYPIVLPKNRISHATLAALYNQFIQYNDDNKLQTQYNNSKSYCYIRAHFVNELLGRYGIASVKVLKAWNPSDWKEFSDNKSWKFHCAAMIVDNENNKWVWDPWVGFNHRLLSLQQWVYQKDEPTPIKLLIAHRVVVNDIEQGHHGYGTRFSQLTPKNISTFQAVYSDAVPNPPSHQLCRNRLFQPNELTIIPYVGPASYLKKT